MTNPTKNYSQSQTDTTDDLEEAEKEKRTDFMRIAKAATDKGQLLKELYENMLMEIPEPETFDELYDQYEKFFTDLQRNIIQTSILKGADYIDSITPDHPKHQAANDRYNKLVKELEELK